MTRKTPKGFEISPLGELLTQVIDLEGPLGVAYERGIGFHKDFHAHDRLMLMFPRGGCQVNVTFTSSRRRFAVDSRTVLVVPAELEHDDIATSMVYDTIALYPSAELVREIAAESGVGNRQRSAAFRESRELPRSHNLELLLDAYFFERIIRRGAAAAMVSALGRAILQDVVLTAAGQPRAAEALDARAINTSTAKAIRYIEGHLFEPIDLPRLAVHVGASVSSLLRHFREQVGLTPGAYIRGRRLDEAMVLLRKGRHQVGEVAALVGYGDFSAFVQAFKRRHGKVPSAFIKHRRGGLP